MITHEWFLPDHPLGGEKIIYELAKGLQIRGHEIKVLTTGNPRVKEFDGIQTIRLPINRYFMNLVVPWIYKHARNFDLIQTNNYNACFPSFVVGKLLKKPVVCIVTGLAGKTWTSLRGPVFGYLSQKVEKFQLRQHYDRVVFYSDFARDNGLKIGIPREVCRVVSPGVEYEKFSRISTKEPYVLFVGGDIKRKGIYYLCDAAEQLPGVKFKVAGARGLPDGKKPPGNVEFLGMVHGEPLYELFAKASVFCLPSLSETFGLVILEAMAAGCAVVSTMPLDYEGVRIEPRNSVQIKEAIVSLLNNRKETVRMGEINRQKAKQRTWQAYAEKFNELYQDVLSDRERKT